MKVFNLQWVYEICSLINLDLDPQFPNADPGIRIRIIWMRIRNTALFISVTAVKVPFYKCYNLGI